MATMAAAGRHGLVGRSMTVGGLAAALVLVPAVFAPALYDDFTLAKQVTVVVSAAVAVGGVLVAGGGVRAPRAVWMALAAWLAWSLAASLVGEDPRASVTGVYQYRQGLVTLAAYAALFVAAANVAGDGPRVWRSLSLAGMIGLAATFAYVVLQSTGNDPIDWWTDTAVRAIGPIGNANELAAYAVVALVWAGLPPVEGGGPSRLRFVPVAWPGLFAGLATFAVLESESRSGIAGLVAVFVLLPLAWRIVGVEWRRLVPVAAACAAGVAMAIAFSAAAGGLTGSVNRVATANAGGDASGSTRSSLLEGTWEVIQAGPLTGAGVDGLILAFPLERPLGLTGTFEQYDLPVQSSHNWLMDVAANTGVPGLALMLAFLVLVAVRAFRDGRGTGDESLPWLWAGGLGYCGVALLNPLSLAAHMTFFVVLGLLAGRSQAPGRERRAVRGGRAWPAARWASLGVPVVAAVFGVRLVRADIAAEDAWGEFASGRFERAARSYAEASEQAPWERDYASREARSLLAAAVISGERSDLELARIALMEFDGKHGFSYVEALALVAADVGLELPADTTLADINRALELNPNGIFMADYTAELRKAAQNGGTLHYDSEGRWVYVLPLPQRVAQ